MALREGVRGLHYDNSQCLPFWPASPKSWVDAGREVVGVLGYALGPPGLFSRLHPPPMGCVTLGESLGLGFSIWTMGPCPTLSVPQVGVGISRKERVRLWDKIVLQHLQHPSPHGLRQLLPKKQLSTNPESKHRHLQRTSDTATWPCPQGAYCQSQSARRGGGREKPDLNLRRSGRRSLHSHSLDAVAAQVYLPYET